MHRIGWILEFDPATTRAFLEQQGGLEVTDVAS